MSGDTRWEYELVYAQTREKFLGLLNDLGREGWEAVSALGVHGPVLLKRRLPDEAEPSEA